MIIKLFLILASTTFAQTAIKQSKVNERVNEHLQKTNKKIEIEGQKKEVELKKDAPLNLKPEAAPKKKAPFIVNPKKDQQDSTVLRDQYDHNIAKDPSTEFEQGIIEERNAPPPGMTNQEYIRQFKENAAKAGVQVEVDPKTLKAKPVKNNGNH